MRWFLLLSLSLACSDAAFPTVAAEDELLLPLPAGANAGVIPPLEGAEAGMAGDSALLAKAEGAADEVANT